MTEGFARVRREISRVGALNCCTHDATVEVRREFALEDEGLVLSYDIDDECISFGDGGGPLSASKPSSGQWRPESGRESDSTLPGGGLRSRGARHGEQFQEFCLWAHDENRH